MSTLKDNSLLLKKEIKKNFELFSQDNNGIIETEQLNDFINRINSKKKSPFIYNSIKNLTAMKKRENDEGITSEELISYIDNQLNDDKSNEGLKNIFDVFCDSNTGNISWNTFPLIVKELGNNEIAEKLFNIIKQSKMHTKELNFKEFYDIMNNDNETINKTYTFKNNETSEYSENINYNNLNINEYLEDYEEKPTYKQRKLLQKQSGENESDITYSSKKSLQENDDININVEEKFYNNDNNDNNEKTEDNDKSNKRYHRRYRSKKVKSNYNENIENENININNHKSYTKYRKKHPNY
jgi:Ca2+-binding EF-hand superfamily protein